MAGSARGTTRPNFNREEESSASSAGQIIVYLPSLLWILPSAGKKTCAANTLRHIRNILL